MFIASSIIAVATIWFCMLLHYNHKLRVALRAALEKLEEHGLLYDNTYYEEYPAEEDEAYATEETT